jgi:hypothetical protein
VHEEKDTKKGEDVRRKPEDFEESKRLMEEESIKKGASTQSRLMSDLVNYTGEFRMYSAPRSSSATTCAEAVKFSEFSGHREVWQMSSFSESKALQLCEGEVRDSRQNQ